MAMLKLNIYGQVYQFNLKETFDMEVLKQYCELENVKRDDHNIYAKVNHFTRPFSELLTILKDPLVE